MGLFGVTLADAAQLLICLVFWLKGGLKEQTIG
jgi:hypothetical protein